MSLHILNSSMVLPYELGSPMVLFWSPVHTPLCWLVHRSVLYQTGFYTGICCQFSQDMIICFSDCMISSHECVGDWHLHILIIIIILFWPDHKQSDSIGFYTYLCIFGLFSWVSVYYVKLSLFTVDLHLLSLSCWKIRSLGWPYFEFRKYAIKNKIVHK